jgi:hypothetical protein
MGPHNELEEVEIIDVEYTEGDNRMTIMDGIKFGVGFFIVYTVYELITVAAVLVFSALFL